MADVEGGERTPGDEIAPPRQRRGIHQREADPVPGLDQAEELPRTFGSGSEKLPSDQLRLDLLDPPGDLSSGLDVPELVDEDPEGRGEPEDADRKQGDRRLAGPQQPHCGAGERRHEREELEANIGQVVEELRRSFVLPLDALGHRFPLRGVEAASSYGSACAKNHSWPCGSRQP